MPRAVNAAFDRAEDGPGSLSRFVSELIDCETDDVLEGLHVIPREEEEEMIVDDSLRG